MALVMQQPHAGFAERQAGEVRVIQPFQIGQAQVQQIAIEPFENLIAAQREQLEAQVRVALAEGLHQLHRVETGQRHHAQAQGADQLTTAGGGFGQQAVLCGEQAARPGQDAFAFGGEAFETLAADHQLQAEFVFQAAQAHRQRRLGDMAARRRLTEMTRFIQRHEKLQLLDIHARSPRR